MKCITWQENCLSEHLNYRYCNLMQFHLKVWNFNGNWSLFSSPEFLNCLRTVSKDTKIMDAPELLPVEAHLSCADKSCTPLDIKMEAIHTALTLATPVNNGLTQLQSQSNAWVSSVLSANTELSTTYPSGSSMMSSSIVSENCTLTEATMCTDSQELHLGPLADIPLPTCDSEMSIVDSLLNNLDSSDSLHHLLSDQPVSLNDITPTPITEGFITHSQTPYTQTFTPHQGHQNAHYSLWHIFSSSTAWAFLFL